MESDNKPWLLWAAILTLIVGVGAGFSALLAPAGVWLGAWDFRQGFSILGAVNPHMQWIALGCLAAAIALGICGQVMQTGNAIKLFVFGGIGALAAGIAWYIPTTFAPAEGEQFPPIHDVSTDLVNPVEYVAIMPLRADAPNTTVYGGADRMTPEENARLQTEAYPDLVPQFYEATEEEMFQRALDAVNSMGWELVDASPDDGRIEATATTFWFRFKDDVVIRIRDENNQTRVDARSLSRVGGGDVGANAIRLRKFFAIL